VYDPYKSVAVDNQNPNAAVNDSIPDPSANNENNNERGPQIELQDENNTLLL